MNPYIDEDIKRICRAQAERNPGPGIFKKFILGLYAILFPMRVRTKNRYRPTIKPVLSGKDSYSR